MNVANQNPNINIGSTYLQAAVGSVQNLTMSSREVADLCEKRHDNVMVDIKKMLKDIGLNAPDFSGTYETAQGNTYRCFNLPKDLTVTLITGYRADLRYKVVKRLEELESGQHQVPQTYADALQLAADQARQITIMQEDVAALERISDADGSYNVTETAKNLGVRPKDLFDWLSHNGWIYKRPGGKYWLGYQDKCNRGLLEHKTTVVYRADGSEKITEQVRVTAKGLAHLAKVVPGVAQEVQ